MAWNAAFRIDANVSGLGDVAELAPVKLEQMPIEKPQYKIYSKLN